MKFCRFLYYVFIILTINSCIANIVSKTEAPAGSAGKSIDPADLNETSEFSPESDSSSSNILAVNSLPADTFKDTSNEISENVGQASQIQSSFEDVSKPKPVVDDIGVNEQLPGVLNQGTLSQDLPDTGTLGVVTLVDSASADLQKLATSASAEVTTESKYEKGSSENTTSETLPPIVIVPPANADQVNDKDKAEVKIESTSGKPSISEPPVVRAEPKVVEQPAKVDEKPEPPAPTDKNAPPIPQQPIHGFATEAVLPPPPQQKNTLDTVPVPSPEIPQEEIPSFSEWTQKQLEEAEKKKGQNKTSSSFPSRGPAPSKMRSKNYASPDCGAKIVATNPEAENPSGVLANSKDEYLINKCSTQRMWLIIELCEAVQAKKIELANFELFSSSPKDFSVYLSHNFPSRDWTSVGQFTAKDERTVQSFNLQPHLFGKFLKVEFNSHYGKEHFCCTSLIRVYGTSEFEVLETENEGHGAVNELDDDDDDEDEQPIGADTGKPSKNLFGHATDAVYTIVRKAAEVLVKSGDSQNQSQTLDQKNTTALIPSFHVRPRHCSTLRHLLVCNNCSPEFFDRVYHLLSCQAEDMQALIESPFVLDTINNSQLCSLCGLDYIAKRYFAAPLQLQSEDQLDQAGYLTAMLPAEYIAALCNILAVLEGKVVLNTSQTAMAQQGASIISKPTPDSRESELKNLLIEHKAPQTCSMDASFTSSHCQSGGSSGNSPPDVSTSFPGSQPGSSTASLASEIKPTRTLTKEEAREISAQEAAVPHAPVQKSVISPDVIPTIQSPSNVKIEPSIISVNTPSGSVEKAKPIPSPPEVPHETISTEQAVLEAPALEKDRDLNEASYNLDSGVSEDQEPSKDLDALFLEMKALDNNDETSSEAGSATTPSSVVTQTRLPSQQAQKESVFLRLSNKIKALERNMSLSGQYLEELSRRYKKQEELSRALNKTLVILREEIKKSKDREQQRDSDIMFLRTQLIQLTAAVEAFQSEKDSWQHKAVVFSQHFALIVIEVVMFGIVIWMCRRFPSEAGNLSASGPQRKWSTGWRRVNKSNVKHLRRRSSLDGISSSSDVKKRRPSEEALQISGSYKDLLLQDENVVVVEGEDISHDGSDQNWLSVSGSRDQRRRRKRRKEGLVKSSSSHNLSQLQANNSQTVIRKISAPMHSYSLPTDAGEIESAEGQSTMREAHLLSNSPIKLKTGDVYLSEAAFAPVSPSSDFTSYQEVQVPPGFAETATSARNRRSFNLAEANLPFHPSISPEWMNHHDGDSGSSVSGQSSRSKGLDSLEPVCNSSQSDNAGILSEEKKKKLGKKGGLKSMVKKFF